MRVTEVSVTKLFGTFDHIIPLRMDDRITIIHGPNGYGKTAILQMLQGALTNQTSIFRRVPFNNFRICFDTNAQLEITKRLKTNGDKEEPHPTLHYQFREKDKKPVDYTVDLLASRKGVDFPLDFIERHTVIFFLVDFVRLASYPTGFWRCSRISMFG